MELFLTLINLKIYWIWLQIFTGARVYLKVQKINKNDIEILLNKLKKHNARKPKKITAKEETLSAAEKLLNNRQEVIDAFKAGIFPYMDGFQIKGESEEESEEKKLEKTKDDLNKFYEYIENKCINYDLFKDYFDFVAPSTLVKQLYKTKKKKKNNELVEEIKKDGVIQKMKLKKCLKMKKKLNNQIRY